jgi:hypothetical protein
MDANTPATQSFPGDSPIEENPIEDNPVQDIPVPDIPTRNYPSTLARPKGPNAAAVVLGLVAMVLAGLIIANETMDLQVDWSRLGPGGIVGIGLVLVVLGAIGLVRRHDDV